MDPALDGRCVPHCQEFLGVFWLGRFLKVEATPGFIQFAVLITKPRIVSRSSASHGARLQIGYVRRMKMPLTRAILWWPKPKDATGEATKYSRFASLVARRT